MSVTVLRSRRGSEPQLSAPLRRMPDLGCGLSFGGRRCAPRWLQPLATRANLTALLAAHALLHAAGSGVLSANRQHLQARLGLGSAATDWLLSGSEVSLAVFSLLLCRFGSSSRPQWLGSLCVAEAVICGLLALPSSEQHTFRNGGSSYFGVGPVNATLCGGWPAAQAPPSRCYLLLLLVVALQVFRGMAAASALVHGLVYLDSNVVSAAAPALFGVVVSVQLLGFRFGEVLSYLASGGATDVATGWWIGWTVLSACLLSVGLLVAMFPPRLPEAAVREAAHSILRAANGGDGDGAGCGRVVIADRVHVIRDRVDTALRPTLRRIISNKVAIFKILAVITTCAAFYHLTMFKNKYLESIFHIPQPKDLFQDTWISRLTTNLLEPVLAALTALSVGLLLAWRRPSARFLAAWSGLAAAISAALSAAQLSLGCHQLSVHGERLGSPALFHDSCNAHCACPPQLDFTPVCGLVSKQTYYSPCHAACTSYSNGLLQHCSCLSFGGLARPWSCGYQDCSSRWVILQSLWVLSSVLRSSSLVTSLLLLIRSVEPEDVSTLLGLTASAVGLCVLIAFKFLFQALVDISCEYWVEGASACKLYESRGLELTVSLYGLVLLACSAALDGCVCACAAGVAIFPDETADDDTAVGSSASSGRRKNLLQRRATPLPRRRRDGAQVAPHNGGASSSDDADDEDSATGHETRPLTGKFSNGIATTTL